VAIGRSSGGTPAKPEFFAEQKMRPNYALQEEALYTHRAIYGKLLRKQAVSRLGDGWCMG
jgi:hypothetical protein